MRHLGVQMEFNIACARTLVHMAFEAWALVHMSFEAWALVHMSFEAWALVYM